MDLLQMIQLLSNHRLNQDRDCPKLLHCHTVERKYNIIVSVCVSALKGIISLCIIENKLACVHKMHSETKFLH